MAHQHYEQRISTINRRKVFKQGQEKGNYTKRRKIYSVQIIMCLFYAFSCLALTHRSRPPAVDCWYNKYSRGGAGYRLAAVCTPRIHVHDYMTRTLP